MAVIGVFGYEGEWDELFRKLCEKTRSFRRAQKRARRRQAAEKKTKR